MHAFAGCRYTCVHSHQSYNNQMSSLSSFVLIPPLQKPNNTSLSKRSLYPPPTQPHRLTIVSSINTSNTSQLPATATATPVEKPSTVYAAPPPPQPSSRRAAIFNALDNFITKFIDPPLTPNLDPKHVLSGNFAPVDELPPTECDVIEGSLPPSLDGAYVRISSNPQFLPKGPYHLFDGDGMLHAIRISKGKASLCSRYVKTYKYNVESENGSPVFPNIFGGFNGFPATAARVVLTAARILSGQLDPFRGTGLANTGLALIGGRLYSLSEYDLPYSIKLNSSDGDIHTQGRYDFKGKLFHSMTVHPKLDPRTGETFGYRYGLMVPPFLTYFRIGADGEKNHPDVPIHSVMGPSFLHDFAITEKYAVFNLSQVVVHPPKALLTGRRLVSVDTRKMPRIGVIPKYAKSGAEMRWFEALGLNTFHVINAWDEDDGDTVVMVAPNMLSGEHLLDRMDLVHFSVEKVKVDLRTGRVSRTPMSTMSLDMAAINPAFVGRKNRYVYGSLGGPMPKVAGVVKLDLSISDGGRQDCAVASRLYGPGCFGGEPFFVAKNPDDPNADEDDGYLMTYVHDENCGESSFLVMDAKSRNLDIVATVRLPRRVPYGFHGLFITEDELNKL